tara:strand:+ start:626 stop:901 length:276 start_codon:yes stop_codon:yes gene_type:complete
MRPVQEGGVGNASTVGHSNLGKAAISINHQSLPTFLVLSQGVIEGLLANDYPRVVKLALVERGKVLSVPSRKVGNGFCHLKNSPFLGKSVS